MDARGPRLPATPPWGSRAESGRSAAQRASAPGQPSLTEAGLGVGRARPHPSTAVFPGPPHSRLLSSLHLQDYGVSGSSGWGNGLGEVGTRSRRREGQTPPQKGLPSSHRSRTGWPLSPHRLQAPALARLPPAGQRTPSSSSHPLFSTQKTFFIVETIPDPDNPAEGGLSSTPQMAGAWDHLRWHPVPA